MHKSRSRQTMASCIMPTDSKARFWKYMLLLVDAGTFVLRDHFNDQLNSQFPGTGLARFLNSFKIRNELRNLSYQNILEQKQYDLLYPHHGQPDLYKFDISLLLRLLKHLFRFKEPKQPLDANDRSIEADLYRLRQTRNEQAHTSNTALTEGEFLRKWHDLKKILLRLGSNIPDLKARIDELKDAPIEPAREKELQAIHAQLHGEVADLSKKSKQLREDVEELQVSTKGLREELSKVAETVKEARIPPKLKHLISSSEDFLDDCESDDCESDDFYVKTAAYEKAKKVLISDKILVISGLPGEGKTTMAKKLASELSAPRKCIVLEDPEDWENVDTDMVPIDYLLIDDIFGAGALNRSLAKRWEKYLKRIKRRMKRAKISFGVIITTRHYILEEALLDGRFDTFFKDKNIVNLSSKDLSIKERSHILEAHLKKRNREIGLGFVDKCIHTNSIFYKPFSFREPRDFTFGFPQCVDMFVNNDALFNKGSEFFNKPNELFMDVLEGLKRNSEDETFLALILTWVRNGKPVLKCDLNCHSPSNDLESIARKFGFSLKNPDTLKKVLRCLKHHKDDIFDYKTSTGAYTFSHNVIKDMVGLVLAKEYQEQTLEYSSRDFIIEYLTTDVENNNKYNFYVEGHLYTKLSRKLIELLLCNRPIFRRGNFRQFTKDGRCPSKVVSTKQIDVGVTKTDAFENKKFVRKFVQHASRECQDLFQMPVMVMSGYFLGQGIITIAVDIHLQDYCLLQDNDLLLSEVMQQGDTHGMKLSSEQLDISLTIAVHKGMVEMVRRLLRNGAIVTQEMVYIAATKEDIILIKELVMSCTSLESSTVFKIVEGNSPLIISAKKNLEKSVRCLVENGADLGYRNTQGYCALDKAVLFRHTTVCEVLLQAGSSVNERSGKFKRTPLHVASDVGSVDIVELLLQHGSKVDIKDHRGHFPIHCAAFRGHTEVVEVLLKHDIDQAQQRAMSYGSKSVIRGMTVFHIAVWRNNPDLMEMLVNSGAIPDLADCFGRTPVYCAAFDGKEALVKLLVPHSNLNKADKQGRTPLHAAVIRKHGSIARLLCPLVNVNAVDKNGNTPLHEACKRGELDMVVELLTMHNADYRMGDKRNRTAYEVATRRVKFVLKSRFDITAAQII